jgi:O-antigen ligase
MGKRKLPAVLSMAVIANLAALYFTQNRQSFLALFAAVFVIACIVLARGFTLKRAGLFSAVLLLLASLLAFQFVHRVPPVPGTSAGTEIHEQTKQDVRWPVWKRVASDVAQDPLVGSGFGLRTFTFKYEGKVQFEGPFWHAHNMLLNKAVQMGVPGVIAFLLLFWAMPWKARKGLDQGRPEEVIALAGIALACTVFFKNMTDDFFTRDCALLYWLLAGATLGSLRHCVREKAQ